MQDLGVNDEFLAMLGASAPSVVSDVLMSEMTGLAEHLGVPLARVLAGNLYYDTLKFMWGCTAFAVDTDTGPIHARNLDWSTKDRLLNDSTFVTRFLNAPSGEFLTIGWPGFIGVLSAVAPGRFAITLNAVLSDDPPLVACPVVFLLRQVLEEASTFEAAVEALSSTPIASDCLLLVSGARRSQMVVIERTPTRHAIRYPHDGAIFVTNNYVSLVSGAKAGAGALQETSCDRFNRIRSLFHLRRPALLEQCLDYLADAEVQMTITVQQMAFDPRTGTFSLRVP